jgi:hypothetical protein
VDRSICPDIGNCNDEFDYCTITKPGDAAAGARTPPCDRRHTPVPSAPSPHASWRKELP